MGANLLSYDARPRHESVRGCAQGGFMEELGVMSSRLELLGLENEALKAENQQLRQSLQQYERMAGGPHAAFPAAV